MKEFQWPYPDIDKSEFLAQQAASVERILQKYGAEYIGDVLELCTWTFDNIVAFDNVEKHIWKREEWYIRVDRVYFPEKPFFVLEFSKQKD